MVYWYHSITTKLTAAFIILIIIIAGMSVLYTLGATKSALKETTREELTALATLSATQINGDALESLNSGDENLPAFIALRDQLYSIEKSSPEILYVYLMRKTGDSISFVVDGDYGKVDDAAKIGDVYDTPTPEMIAGFISGNADKEFTTDQWGEVMSGYAPIHDSKGNIVGIIGIDMSANRVIERQDFIGSIIYLIILIGIIITSLIIGFFSRTMIRDIKSLNNSAARISSGDMDVLVTIERNDEIGELAGSFSRMVSSLKIMMMDDDD
jgi:adenylate cyclase